MPSSSAAAGLPSYSHGNSYKPRPTSVLEQTDPSGRVVSVKPILPGKELIIGRDRTKYQLFIDDPCISARHLRVYSVVYDVNDTTEVDTLVYAEDLSRNGTYWNGSLIGRGNGGFLLSPDDVLRLSSGVSLTFKCKNAAPSTSYFDEIQEMEMERFGSNYIVTDRLLGSGAFGKVLMAIEQTTRTQLACKVVDLRRLRPTVHFGRREGPLPADEVDFKDQLRKVKEWGDQQKRENKLDEKLKIYYREAEILASIRHPNIIGLEKVFVTDNTIYMFQDLITGGDLFSYLESKHGRLSEVEAAVIVRQVVIALCFLHENNIVHRDLKPDNILMTSLSTGCRVVLTDFGSARRYSTRSRMMSLAGTSEYVAPEVTSDGSVTTGYTRAVDQWSLGCVTAVLLTGASAFTDPMTQQYSEVLAKKCDLQSLRQSSEWQLVRPRPKDFVERLLVLAEDERMTAPQALKHGWFSNDHHKTNFEDLYVRTIKHWRPRPTRNDLLEFSDASGARKIARAQGLLPEKSRRRGPKPSQILESHYKPFPRQLHSSSLWPKRRPSPSYIAPETKSAIDNWPSSDEEALEGQDASSPAQLSSARSRRRRSDCLQLSGPLRSSPSSKGRIVTPSRSRDFSETHTSTRQISLPNTPKQKRSTSMNPFTVPLRLANANAKISPLVEGSERRVASTPTKLKRREEMKSPLTPSNGRSKKRLASVYDMDETEDYPDMLSQKRPRAKSHGDQQELSLPHRRTAIPDDEPRVQLR